MGPQLEIFCVRVLGLVGQGKKFGIFNMTHSYGRLIRGDVDRETDFVHAQFVYLHAEIKVPMRKSPNTSKFAGISSL